MPNSPVAKKRRLISPWAFLPLSVVIGSVIFYTWRDEGELFKGETEDQVSLQYLQVLVANHPEDLALRRKLIDQQLSLGQLEEARPLIESEHLPVAVRDFYRLALGIQELYASGDVTAQPQLIEQLSALPANAYTPEEVQALIAYALGLNAPLEAARLYEHLEQRMPQQGAWLQKAAGQYLAGGRPDLAATMWLKVAEQQSGEEKLLAAQRAYQAYLAADKAADALSVFEQYGPYLKNRDEDIAWLSDMTTVAQGNQRIDLARAYVQLWRQWRPNDRDALLRDFELNLASGDIRAALTLGQQLDRKHGSTPEFVQQLARLSEWNGESATALSYWVRYLQDRPDPVVREHTWRLSMQLFDFDQSIRQLAQQGEHQRLNDEQLDALVYAFTSRGTPEDAVSWLEKYLKRYPSHELAWDRLIFTLENIQAYEQEGLAWQGKSKHFPLTLEERIFWAETWRKRFRPEEALAILTLGREHTHEPAYWRAKAELAWEMEDDEALLEAYEKLLANQEKLLKSEEWEYIRLYRERDPRRALQLLAEVWRRDGEPRPLMDALDLAMNLSDWELVKALMSEVPKDSTAWNYSSVWIADSALLKHQGKFDLAEKRLLQGLKHIPQSVALRAQVLWLYIEQGRRKDLPAMLNSWQIQAVRDSRLWLPYAAAYQLLGKPQVALNWYGRYIASQPQDWLVNAAYADALDEAGWAQNAFRLRQKLLRNGLSNPAIRRGKLTPAELQTWLYLRGSHQSWPHAFDQARQWQDGSPALLQLWFDTFIAQLNSLGNEGIKDQWLGWARSRGLRVERYEQIQEALRHYDRDKLQAMLTMNQLDAAQEVEALKRLGHTGPALARALEANTRRQPEVIREQAWRQAVEMLEQIPQGIQIAYEQKKLGALDWNAAELTVARYLSDSWYGHAQVQQGRYKGDRLKGSALPNETQIEAGLRRDLNDGWLDVTVDSSQRSDSNRMGIRTERSWQLTSRDQLGVVAGYGVRTQQGEYLQALGKENNVSLLGSHSFSARDAISWQLGHRWLSMRDGSALGKGQFFSIEAGHQVFFESPSWRLRTALEWQRNQVTHSVSSRWLEDPFKPGQGLTEDDLLQRKYGRWTVGSIWRRGYPGALNRSRGQYTWMVDVNAGWDLYESKFTYGLSAGWGMELLGDDELAITAGYQSAPQGSGGNSGGEVKVSYSKRFGR